MKLLQLLEATGMSRRDRESMLEMIMEASGAREIVQQAMKVHTILSPKHSSDCFLAMNFKVTTCIQHLDTAKFSAKNTVLLKLRAKAFREFFLKDVVEYIADFFLHTVSY